MLSKLRHPVRAIREPFGTAGLIVACVALVLALTGAAFAAGKLTGPQKKEVEKIAKKFQGTGPAGPEGKQGPGGSNGKDGTNGTNGSNGAAGAAGKSVKLVNTAPANCTEGGVTYEVEGSGVENEVCNGEEGAQGDTGPEGVCSTSSCHLPSGVTETGVWTFGKLPNIEDPENKLEGKVKVGVESIRVPISFPIPLGTTLSATECSTNPPAAGCHVHYLNASNLEVPSTGVEIASTACPGTYLEPKATQGNLCVYTKTLIGVGGVVSNGSINKGATGATFGPGAFTAGAFLLLSTLEERAVGVGSWAVTGP